MSTFPLLNILQAATKTLFQLAVGIIIAILLFLFISRLVTHSPPVTKNDREKTKPLNFITIEADTRKAQRKLPSPPKKNEPIKAEKKPIEMKLPAPKLEIKRKIIDLPKISQKMTLQPLLQDAPQPPQTKLVSNDVPEPVNQQPAVTSDVIAPEMAFLPYSEPARRVKPQYPRNALRRNIEAQVDVEFVVDENGKVQMHTIKIVESRNSRYFRRPIFRALKQFRYAPLIRDGKAVSFRSSQRFNFVIK